MCTLEASWREGNFLFSPSNDNISTILQECLFREDKKILTGFYNSGKIF